MYQVHAEIMRTGESSADFDEAKAGHPLERRLNRIERVAAAYRGRVDLRFASGVLMTFDSADAALLGACEMQNRCALLPQVSKQKLSLRVGIHQSVLRQRAKDPLDNAQEIATRLATIDDGIVLSNAVMTALNPDLRRITRPLAHEVADLAIHEVDWRSEIPSAAYGGESFWPTSVGNLPVSPYLLLHHGLKSLELTHESPIVTVGRDPQNDLVFVDIHISRNHCRIERKGDGIVLTDSSTNGTTVAPDLGEVVVVKNTSFVLKGKGLLFFGRPFKGERRGGVRFEAY